MTQIRMRLLAWLVLAALGSIAVAESARAAPVGTAFTYQGQLKQAGAPFNGMVDLDCTLWDDETAGNQIGAIFSVPGVIVTNGLFTAQLNFGAGMFDGDKRWLRISVNGTPLSPRQELTPAPYAIFATRPWATGGTDIFYTDGNVGIGTSVPGAKLHIDGTPGQDGLMFPDGTLQTTAAIGTPGGVWSLNGTNAYYNAGKVGIGRNDPPDPLSFANTVGDKISLYGDTGGTYGFGIQGGLLQIHTNNSSADVAFGHGPSTAFTERMRIRGNGNVGIGISTPAYPLTIKTSAALAGYGWMHTDGTREFGSYISSTGGWLGTRSNHPLFFFTNDSTPRVTLSADGTLGVGTTIPSAYAQFAVFGGATNRAGYFESDRGGLTGWSNSSGFTGITGGNSQGGGVGVYSVGNFVATGTKSFQIDHPLDPENKYLTHYCAEGPEPLNVYRGNVMLDAAGEAWVTLPDYFAEINRDPSYQLTPIGESAPVFVKQKIAGNRFLVAGGKAGIEVSWRVEAVRNDRFVRAYGAAVESAKPADKLGTYLQPALYGQPAEKSQFHETRTAESPVLRETTGSSN